jgi:hypothetical protein
MELFFASLLATVNAHKDTINVDGFISDLAQKGIFLPLGFDRVVFVASLLTASLHLALPKQLSSNHPLRQAILSCLLGLSKPRVDAFLSSVKELDEVKALLVHHV